MAAPKHLSLALFCWHMYVVHAQPRKKSTVTHWSSRQYRVWCFRGLVSHFRGSTLTGWRRGIFIEMMYFAQYGTLNVEKWIKTKRCGLFLLQILWFPSCGGHTATLPLSKVSRTLRVVLQNGICCRPKRVRKRLVLYPEEGHTAGA